MLRGIFDRVKGSRSFLIIKMAWKQCVGSAKVMLVSVRRIFSRVFEA